MRKLLGVLAVSSLCLILGFGTTGCTPPKKTGDKFKGDSETGKISKADGTAKVTFTKEVKSVDPDAEKDGVKATFSGKDVTFTLKGDLPAAETKVVFKVKSKEEKDEAFTVTITVEKKPAKVDTDTKPADVTLDAETLSITLVADGEAKGSVKIKTGKAEVDAVKEDKKGVTAKIADGVLWVIAEKTTAPGKYWVLLKSTEKKEGAKLEVTIVAAGTTPPPPPPPEVVKLTFASDKFEQKLDDVKAWEDKKLVVKLEIKTGKAVDAKLEKKDDKISVAVSKDGMWVIVTFTKEAAVAGEFIVWAVGADLKADDKGGNKASIKLTLK